MAQLSPPTGDFVSYVPTQGQATKPCVCVCSGGGSSTTGRDVGIGFLGALFGVVATLLVAYVYKLRSRASASAFAPAPGSCPGLGYSACRRHTRDLEDWWRRSEEVG